MFDTVFIKYKDDIYRLAYSYTINKSEAEDIVERTFIKLYKHPKILELEELKIKKWLIRVTINECHDYFRSSYYRKNMSIDDIDKKIEFDSQYQ